MNIPEIVNQLTTRGVRVEVAFEEKSIQQFALWGCAAAIVAGIIGALIRKGIGT